MDKRITKVVTLIDEFGHEEHITLSGYEVKAIGTFLNQRGYDFLDTVEEVIQVSHEDGN